MLRFCFLLNPIIEGVKSTLTVKKKNRLQIFHAIKESVFFISHSTFFFTVVKSCRGRRILSYNYYLHPNLLEHLNGQEFDWHNKFQISLFEEEVATCQLRFSFQITSPYYWRGYSSHLGPYSMSI